MAYLALREIGQHAEVTATGPDVPYTSVPGTLLVDFRHLRALRSGGP